MRRLVPIACLVAVVGLSPVRQSGDPFIPIGVWYGGPDLRPPEVAREYWKDAEAWQRDLDAIRATGFNSITTWTTWAYAEPIRGRYRFDALDQMLRLARDAGLRVLLDVLPEPAPEWHTGPACGADSTVANMVIAANTRALANTSFLDLLHTGTRGDGQCLMTPSLTPKPAGRPLMTPAELGAALDSMRASAGPEGWRLSRLQGGVDVDGATRGPAVTDADLRLWTWAALARGARGVAFDDWQRMVDERGAPTRVALAAGALAANISRNERLYGSVLPRRARVALLHTEPAGSASALYRAAFERNLAVDFVEPGDLLSGAASRYGFLLVEGEQPAIVQQALKVFELAGGKVVSDPASLAGMAPDIRIEGAPGIVEARILESADTWLIVGLNHAETPQKVTFGFGIDIPEAIWVDMETGNSVAFVQSPTGPMLQHTFPARDVLVLVRSKKLR